MKVTFTRLGARLLIGAIVTSMAVLFIAGQLFALAVLVALAPFAALAVELGLLLVELGLYKAALVVDSRTESAEHYRLRTRGWLD